MAFGHLLAFVCIDRVFKSSGVALFDGAPLTELDARFTPRYDLTEVRVGGVTKGWVEGGCGGHVTPLCRRVLAVPV